MVAPSDVYPYHISNKCPWVVELSNLFHWVWRVFYCCHCNGTTCWVFSTGFCFWPLLDPFLILHIVNLGSLLHPVNMFLCRKLPIKQFPWLWVKLHLCLLWWSLHKFYQRPNHWLLCLLVLCSVCLPWILCGYSASDQSKCFGMEVFQTHGTLEQSLEFHNCN